MAANAFQNFIQIELPKRPFLSDDPAEESVLVRRGSLPRQLEGVALGEGEVLGKKDGVLQGLPLAPDSNVNGLMFTQETPSTEWVIEHNQSSTSAFVQLQDAAGKVIYADDVHLEPNTTTVSWVTPQAGTAALIFI